MSLRTKLLALFAALAIAPLLAISLFNYWRSAFAVRRLLEMHTAAVANRVAGAATERYALIEGDLSLFANNAETRRLLETGEGRKAAEDFLRQALGVVGASIQHVSVRDTAGAELLNLMAPDSMAALPVSGPDQRSIPTRQGSDRLVGIVLAIRDETGRSIGSLSAGIRLQAIVPPVLLNDRVGIAGATEVVRERERSTRAYDERDTTWIRSTIPIAQSGLAVSSLAAVNEFAAPIGDIWVTNLALALGVTLALALAVVVLVGRVSRPLEALTDAATEVGRGNFSPALPSAGADEVGRLAEAFAKMSAQIGEMMRQVESSRQMAAVGAFSAQIAHEIRNPLTAIKLNLQSLERELRDGTIAPSARRPLEICMEEIQRLDKVVRGVLQLGNTSLRQSERISLHDALRAAASLTQKQLAAHGVTLELDCAAEQDEILGDRDRLRGVLLNLILNAVDALPSGGHIRVSTALVESAGVRAVQVRIADNGPGVARQDRESVFEPFYTTKSHGSGLGLALASRDVESHRGRLSLLDQPGELGGATFVVELPLATSDNA